VENEISLNFKDGYVICSRCNGTGKEPGWDYFESCHKCWGKIKLDWIENITGVEEPCFSSSSISSSAINLTSLEEK
jgi:DnaJ-class molecular chaperone